MAVRSRRLEVIFDDMDDFLASETVKIVFSVHSELVQATPVDLGWARANFVPQIRTPYRANVGDVEPDTGKAAAKASEVQSRLFQIAAQYGLEDGSIFISNNVPYIIPLNNGHSKQAPPGYIPMAIVRGVQSVRGAFAQG